MFRKGQSPPYLLESLKVLIQGREVNNILYCRLIQVLILFDFYHNITGKHVSQP